MPGSISFAGRGVVGPPLLLVHGFPVDGAMWRGQLDGLGTQARVVAVDLPGFGHTPPLSEGDATPVAATVATMDQYADNVIAVADALGFTRFVLAGLSMGGYVALAVARRYGARLAGLALCDTRADADTPAARQQRLADADRVLAGGHQGHRFLIAPSLQRLVSPSTPTKRPEVIAHLTSMMERATPAGVAAALRGMAERRDARADLRQIAVPALVVVGADDVITPPEAARQLAAAIPGAELAVISEAGHMAPLEAPDAVNTALRRLLRRAAAA